MNLLAITLLSMPAVLGYNLWAGIEPLGSGTTIMDLEDFLVSYNILPLGSLLYVMFCTKKNGWGWDKFVSETNTGSGIRFPGGIRLYMTIILPLIIIVIYLKGYYDMFAGKGTAVLAFWMIVAVALLVLVLSFGRKGKRHS